MVVFAAALGPERRRQNQRARSSGRANVGVALACANTAERWVLKGWQLVGVSWSRVSKLPDRRISASWLRENHTVQNQHTRLPRERTERRRYFPVSFIIYYLQLLRVSAPACEYANEFSSEIKLKIGGDSRTGEENGKIHKLQLNSPTLMKRGEFSSSESPPSQPSPPPQREGSLRLWLAANWEIGSASQCHYAGFYPSPYAGRHQECLKFP